jgi:hypothetical protein
MSYKVSPGAGLKADGGSWCRQNTTGFIPRETRSLNTSATKQRLCPIKQDEEINKQKSGITLLYHTFHGTFVSFGNVRNMPIVRAALRSILRQEAVPRITDSVKRPVYGKFFFPTSKDL